MIARVMWYFPLGEVDDFDSIASVLAEEKTHVQKAEIENCCSYDISLDNCLGSIQRNMGFIDVYDV